MGLRVASCVQFSHVVGPAGNLRSQRWNWLVVSLYRWLDQYALSWMVSVHPLSWRASMAKTSLTTGAFS